MREDTAEDAIREVDVHDAAEPVEADLPEDADEDGAPEPRRSPLRLALASAITTAVGAAIALTLISSAQAGTADPEPSGSAAASAAATAAPAVQQYAAPRAYRLKKVKRDRFTAFSVEVGGDEASVRMPSGPVAPAGEAQTYAAAQVADRGWAKREFACLVSLWSKESGWNAHAGRPGGPYGIPQAYPGTKMASAGGDWLNDHRVQIRWGIGYIAGRWGTPCKAWANSQAHGSY